MSETSVKRIFSSILRGPRGAPIDELRGALGIKPEDLVEEVEACEIKLLREKERGERLQ